MMRPPKRRLLDRRRRVNSGSELASPLARRLDQFLEVCRQLATGSDLSRVCQRLASRGTECLGAPVVVFRKPAVNWKIAARPQGGNRVSGLPAGLVSRTLQRAEQERGPFVLHPRHLGEPAWTSIPLAVAEGPQLAVLLPGDWTVEPLVEWADDVARELSLALHTVRMRERLRLTDSLVSLTRMLAQRPGEPVADAELHDAIVRSAAATVGARRASLLVPDEPRHSLRIVATHGYPLTEVENLRVARETGILGAVFASGRPALVPNVHQVPGLSTQPERYRTPSFLVVPVLSGGETFGVLSLADRADGGPFGPRDLVAAQAIANSAGLALACAHLAGRARQLAHLATVDPLTGLFNRRYLHLRMDEEIERARRYGLNLAAALVDIDDFKSINDSLGHSVGDQVLAEVARILRQTVRLTDVCARLGGDEFAVLMPGTDFDNAGQSAERLRKGILGSDPIRVMLPPPARLNVTASVGVTVWLLNETGTELLARADRALYLAKAAGKNRVSGLRDNSPPSTDRTPRLKG